MRFLFVDQILIKDQPNYIAGLKHVTCDDPFLSKVSNTHQYCFVPSLMGETIGQLAAWKVMHAQRFQRRPVAGVVAEATIVRPAYLGDTLLVEAFIDDVDETAVEYHGQASIHGEVVFSIRGAIGPLLPMQDFIDVAVVRQQFQELDRPIFVDLQEYLSGFATLPKTMRVPAHECCIDFDGIIAMHPRESCRAYKKISRSALYFADHFPYKPVLPLTILIECCSRLAQRFLQESAWEQCYRLVKMARIKMNDFVQPGDVIETELTIKKHSDQELVLHLRSYVQQKRVCVLDLVYQGG